jgi:hypothetical protein
MAPQASEKGGLLPLDHKRIARCTSRSINVELLAGTLSPQRLSSLSPQASAQSEKWALTLFLFSRRCLRFA